MLLALRAWSCTLHCARAFDSSAANLEKVGEGSGRAMHEFRFPRKSSWRGAAPAQEASYYKALRECGGSVALVLADLLDEMRAVDPLFCQTVQSCLVWWNYFWRGASWCDAAAKLACSKGWEDFIGVHNKIKNFAACLTWLNEFNPVFDTVTCKSLRRQRSHNLSFATNDAPKRFQTRTPSGSKQERNCSRRAEIISWFHNVLQRDSEGLLWLKATQMSGRAFPMWPGSISLVFACEDSSKLCLWSPCFMFFRPGQVAAVSPEPSESESRTSRFVWQSRLQRELSWSSHRSDLHSWIPWRTVWITVRLHKDLTIMF